MPQLDKTDKKSVSFVTVTLYGAMFAYAFSVTALGPLLLELMGLYRITLGEAGLYTLLQGLGAIVGLLMGLFFGYRFAYYKMVFVLFGVYILSLFAMATLPLFPITLLLFFCIGLSTKLLDAVLSAYVVDLHMEHRPKYLGRLHACFGLGALGAPLLISYLLRLGAPCNAVFVALATICVVIYAAFLLAQRSRSNTMEQAAAFKINTTAVWTLLRDINVILLAMCTMLYASFASGVSTWVPSYMTTRLGMPGAAGNYPVYAMWVGIILGRLAYGRFTQRFPARMLVLFSSLAGGVLLQLASICDMAVPFIAAYGICGFLIGAVMPLSLAFANQMHPADTTAVIAMLTLSAAVGIMVFPALVGMLAEQNYRLSIALLNAFPLLIALCMACARICARKG